MLLSVLESQCLGVCRAFTGWRHFVMSFERAGLCRKFIQRRGCVGRSCRVCVNCELSDRGRLVVKSGKRWSSSQARPGVFVG